MKPSQNTHIENWGEGDIKPQYPETGGQQHFLEHYYGFENCKYTSTEQVQVPNPDYKDPSDPEYNPDDPSQQDEYITEEVTETIGIASTASLQAWLAGLESAGFKLWKRKVINADPEASTIEVGWEEATATDFEVIDMSGMGVDSGTTFIKAIDDPVIEAIKTYYPNINTDAQAVVATAFLNITGIKFSAEEGAFKYTQWHFDQLSSTYYVDCTIQVGIHTSGSEEQPPIITIENNCLAFGSGD